MSFDDAINNILKEQHFGGAPFEQLSGVKKHITYESTDSLAAQLQNAFDEHAPYYSRDDEDIQKFQDFAGGRNSRKPDGQYVEFKDRQEKDDEIVTKIFGDADLIKVDIQQGGVDGDIHVYALRDERMVDSLKPLALIAMSPDDHGMDAKVGPLDQWDEIMIGHKLGDKLGSFVNHDGDTIRRNKPVLKDKGGKGGRIYVGPAKDLKGMSNKEPGEAEPSVTSDDKPDSGEGLSGFAKAKSLASGIDFSKYK